MLIPPKTLTMEEYRRNWKPDGWRIIIIGPTSTWRQEWGEWEAIRDIVQNSLDETESYSFGSDDKGLWIADSGRGVAVADFLLGPPKLKPDYARGKFGEGMKISALALTRLNYRVYVETVGRELWIIFLEQEVNGKAETLAALWRPNGSKLGTKFTIHNYFGSSFSSYFTTNLPKEAIVAEAPSYLKSPIPRKNQLISYGFPEEGGLGWVKKGRIFCRDIFLRDIDSIFSYNLWGFELAPDRHGPKNESDLWVDVGRTWACVNDTSLLENFLRMVAEPPLLVSEESHKVDMSPWSMGKPHGLDDSYLDIMNENGEVWETAWYTVFGTNVVIRTSDRWDSMVKHLGYRSRNVSYNTRDALGRIIKTDIDLVKESQERLRDVKIIPESQLTPKQLIHLVLAKDITARLTYGVSGIFAGIIPPASDRVRTAGMYSKTFKEIYISLEQLDRAGNTIDTIIHEIAHHSSGAEDLERGHADEMTSIAARVVAGVAQGYYDTIIKSPNFEW